MYFSFVACTSVMDQKALGGMFSLLECFKVKFEIRWISYFNPL